MDEQISLIKNWGNETVKEKNYQPVMAWLCLGLVLTALRSIQRSEENGLSTFIIQNVS